MDKTLANERLNQAIEYLKNKGQARTHLDMATLMGIRQPHLTSAIKGDERRLTEGLLRKFAAAYSDYIDETWLLTGEGKMAKPERDLRPHIETKVRAGFMDDLSEGDHGENLLPVLPFFKDYDFTIKVIGDTMEPVYREGDILACRKVNDSFNPLIGKVCVLDTIEGAVVKVIKGTAENGVVCHSFNNNYPDYEIQARNINQTAVVVGSIRMEE